MAEIHFHFESIEPFSLPSPKISEALLAIATKETGQIEALNVIFCSDEYLLDVNQRYLNHDFYTDVITFDYSDESISGDIYISIDRIEENAKQFDVSFTQELGRVIIHGLLHLLGYGDKTPEETTHMRSKEQAYLSLFPKFNVPRGTV